MPSSTVRELAPRRRSGARSASGGDEARTGAEGKTARRAASESPRWASDGLDYASTVSRTSSSTRSSLSEFAFEMELPDTGTHWVPEECSVPADAGAATARDDSEQWAPSECEGWSGTCLRSTSEPARGVRRAGAAHGGSASGGPRSHSVRSRGGDHAADHEQMARIPSCERAYEMEMCQWGQASSPH